MTPDPTKQVLDTFQHLIWTRLVPLMIALAIGVLLIGILKIKFENWFFAKVRNWKQNRDAKAYAGMSEDEILDTPHCPVCNRMMKLRTAKSSGSQFWGCGAFPKCRGTRAYQN
jgi:hypothetical protein